MGIYQTLCGVLAALPEITETQVQPNGANLSDIALPAAIWAQKTQEEVADLSGEVHHYETVFLVDFLAATVDECLALAAELRQNLALLEDAPDGAGNWVFETEVSEGESGYSYELDCMRVRSEVTVRWCKL